MTQIDKVYLAKKHKGMKVDYSGVLNRLSTGKEKIRKDQRYMLGVLSEHLEEVSKLFYEGEIKAVDEFFQVWCLDKHRPVYEEAGE